MPNLSWARNPLAILAIFIWLIYGIAGLTFIHAPARLTEQNQTLLVLFIIIFPFIVLGVFAWLVVKHHQKLYGPGDYRSDDTFASTFVPATNKQIVEKQEAEVRAKELAGDQAHVEVTTAPTTSLPNSDNQEADLPTAEKVLASDYFLETLALKRLGKETGARVHHEVVLNGLLVDGVIVNDSVKSMPKFTFVEVKVIDLDWYLFTAIQEASRTLAATKKDMSGTASTLLVIVFRRPFSMSNVEKEMSRLAQDDRPDQIKVYGMAELLRDDQG